MPAPARAPLPFHPSDERPERHEPARAAALRRLMGRIRETTWRDTGHAARSLHAKSHALLAGEMEVPGGLPPALAQGLFASPGRYPVVMRLSTNRGDMLDDDVSVPRGMALKVIGVEGERLPGSEDSRTQDFVLVNQPAFTEPDLRVFRRNIAFVAATTHAGMGWKKALGALLRPVVAAVRALGGQAATLTTMGGHPATHPLGETYFSQVPFRHGRHVAKYALAPASAGLLALRDRPVALRGRPNALREAAIAFFARQGAAWELRAQLRTDARTMPIEDASAEWPERQSPYVTVARITAPPQPAWNEARARVVDDGLAFSPWNGLAAHRPLGSVNRARLLAYREGAAFRAARNRCPIAEPRAALALPAGPAEAFARKPGREGLRDLPGGAPERRWRPPGGAAPREAALGLAALALIGAALTLAAPRR